jgi:hypothetical protein
MINSSNTAILGIHFDSLNLAEMPYGEEWLGVFGHPS